MGLKKYLKKAVKALGYTPFTGFGMLNTALGDSSNPFGAVVKSVGIKTRDVKKAANQASDDAQQAAANALVEQEQAGMRGTAEEIARRRAQRGFLATLLGGGAPGYGLNSTLGRKSLLGGR
jgi:hypothetical protein